MEQWEAYFGQLAAAGCDDGVRLSTAEMALLAVHGAYSSRLEEVTATHLLCPPSLAARTSHPARDGHGVLFCSLLSHSDGPPSPRLRAAAG